jgi:allophanate hydrolase
MLRWPARRHHFIHARINMTFSENLSCFGVGALLEAYLDGALSPSSCIESVLTRIEESARPEAWILRVDAAELRTQAKQLDTLLAQEGRAVLDRLPLFGVPFAVKDNIDVAGLPTTAGCPAFAYIPERSAFVVEQLLRAGALLVGKTNLDQFATGLVGTRSPYGRPACAFSNEHISGGSSSGSAVAVAQGVVAFALGTDTAGSGRIPAGFNQIVGLKPTPGRVSTAGVTPACRSLDCVSIFALTVDDAAHVLSIIEGHDPQDPFSKPIAGPSLSADAKPRIGVPKDAAAGLSDEYSEQWALTLDCLSQAGHEVVPIDFAILDEIARLLYDGPWVAERYAVIEDLLKRDPDALDATVRQVVQPAETFRAVDVFRAQYRLKELSEQASSIWNTVEMLVVPTAPSHPRFDEVDADPIGVNASLGRFTNFVNLLGWSALAVPQATTTKGMPFGITLIAGHGHDAVVTEFGRRWHARRGLQLGATGVGLEQTIPTRLRRPATAPTIHIAVVGAHLSGLPLNVQLTERGAVLTKRTKTSANYRLFALPGSVPPKPGLQRTHAQGCEIEVEVWEMPVAQYGSFVAMIAPPLGIGRIELVDGQWVQGFVCEAYALSDAPDISRYGRWKAYLASLTPTVSSQ